MNEIKIDKLWYETNAQMGLGIRKFTNLLNKIEKQTAKQIFKDIDKFELIESPEAAMRFQELKQKWVIK